MSRRVIVAWSFLFCAASLFGAEGVSPATGADIPQDLMAAVTRARYAVRFETDGRTPAVSNYAQDLRARFGERGIEVEPRGKKDKGSGPLRIELAGWGREGSTRAPGAASRAATENRVEYAYEGLTEWWINTPRGLEQGFTIADPRGVDRARPLVIDLAVGGSWQPQMDGGKVVLLGEAGERLQYDELVVIDARGERLPARLAAGDANIRITVADEGAVYPLTVDPLLTSEEAHLFLAGKESGAEFGTSVAITGDTAVVGAPSDDNAGGRNAGSAYVFVRSGTSWSQQAQLLASDGAAGDRFGNSVAISGDMAVVGAHFDDTAGGSHAGSAYVYVRSGTSWSQQAHLFASDGAATDEFDEFGYSVAISGDTAVVGAHYDHTAQGSDAGSAYVYVRSGTSWSQQAQLFASDSAASDQFGNSVAISGNTAVVGAPGHSTAGGSGAGSAYVYVRSGTSWSQQAKLLASDGLANDVFGISVAISDDTAVVGAVLDNTAGGIVAGSAYVYVRSGTSWSQQTHLIASDGAASDLFGASVAISGNTAVVGAHHDHTAGGSDAGSAYVYVRSGTSWSQQAQLFASDGAASDQFGNSVAISGDMAVVGAYFDDNAGGSNAGSAFVFVRSGTSWSQQAHLFASDGLANDFFGTSVAISCDRAVVGAYSDDTSDGTNAGSAYIYRLGGPNDSPVAAADAVTAAEDTALTFAASTLTTNDSPGPPDESTQTLTVSAVAATSTQGGMVSLSGGNITYTPPANVFGADSFTYTVTDDGCGPQSATGTVNVTVTEVNDAPSASADARSTAQATVLTFAAAPLTTNDSPGPANESTQTLSVTGVSATSTQGGTVSLSGGNITYRPLANFVGADSFSYTVTDDGTTDGSPDPRSATGTVNVTVTEVTWVDVYRGNDANDGSFAAPLKTITAALAAVGPGATITVLPGIYTTATGETFPLPIPSGITLRSADGATQTTIDASGSNQRAITCSGNNSSTLIEGFFITGGFVQPANDGATDAAGGGILTQANDQTTISRCHIFSNEARGYDGTAVNPNGGNGYGGGIAIVDSQTKVVNCVIRNNVAGGGCAFSGGTAGAARGGGIYAAGAASANALFINNTLSFNWSPGTRCGSSSSGAGGIDAPLARADNNVVAFNDGFSIGGFDIASATNNLFYLNVDFEGDTGANAIVGTDPLFVNDGFPVTARDLHLRAGSPATGAGTGTGAPAVDFDGYTRPSPPSIGAYEAGRRTPNVRGDFNVDRRADIFWHNEATNEKYLYQMNGFGIDSQAVVELPRAGWEFGGLGDFNGDGSHDTLWRNAASGESIVDCMSRSIVRAAAFVGLGGGHDIRSGDWKVAAIGNFDDSGRDDLFWHNTVTGQNTIYTNSSPFMDAQLGAPGTVYDSVDPSWNVAGYGDFDGDGRTDLLWRNAATGENYLWMNSFSLRGSINVLPDANWKIVGTGDFDGDGKADILWRNTATGENYMYLMNGFTIASMGAVNTIPDSNWKIVATGDYNGDGKSDILWRNSATGENYMYLMNGFTITSTGTVNMIPDANWKVVY
ncbi:MAG TPA: Ig-like domain-containing protein [Thermoanaerobaculia bacterium]|nr:Ig-like domain-containing protein [Thermoanaerobaculia bacterium]